VHSCSAFSNTFNSTGLVGIQASSEPGYAHQLLDVCCRELESLATPPPGEQLDRAKRMSVSLIHNALESKSASAEDIGRQFLTYGHRWGGSNGIRGVDRGFGPLAVSGGGVRSPNRPAGDPEARYCASPFPPAGSAGPSTSQ
jgi:hypothetical protein